MLISAGLFAPGDVPIHRNIRVVENRVENAAADAGFGPLLVDATSVRDVVVTDNVIVGGSTGLLMGVRFNQCIDWSVTAESWSRADAESQTPFVKH